MNQAKKKHTSDREPFTLSLYFVPSLETWEEYALRCTDIANYAAQHSPLPPQSTAIDLSDETKFRKVSESAYELIMPSQEVQNGSAAMSEAEKQSISDIIQVLRANIKAKHAAFVPDTAFTKKEMASLVEILERSLEQGGRGIEHESSKHT